MADLVISKKSSQWWYVSQNEGVFVDEPYSGDTYAIRTNSAGTTSWHVSTAFTTGNKQVTNITLYLIDCGSLSQYNSGAIGYFGISATQNKTPAATPPTPTWQGSVSYLMYNSSYNGYTTTINVNLEPNTNYYVYVTLGKKSGYSSVAWDAIYRPWSSSDSRWTRMELTFNDYTTPTYTITYNANGGSGAPSAQTKYKNKSITLSSTKPTRTGYDFVGWGTSTTDTTVDYNPGDTYSANASITLYAIWKAKGLVRIYNGSTWKEALCYVYDGSTWRQAIPYVYNGSSWKMGG